MTDMDRQSRIKAILDEAAALSANERGPYLQKACGDDPELRLEVESLLEHLDLPTDSVSAPHSSESRSDDLVGIAMPTRVGPYSIISKIGEGGMGVVYKATQDFPRRTVALKVIKPHMLTRRALERFRFETQILARLQHQGIAQIYDAGTTSSDMGDVPYFAMEYIRGTPLTEYARLRKLNLHDRLVLMQRIADAVHHAHTRGIVHRDIKPANILVTEDGQPKILDFGVARSIGSDLVDSGALTQFGQLIGTVPYMSPEQVAGDPDELDARSDIYSLGVVLYELLAGHLPYNLERILIQEAVRVIRETEPESLSHVSKVYRGDIETIVNKALAKERSRRYQSASEFSSDITRFLNDEPISARPASAWYQVTKLVRRNRVLAGGVALAACGIVIGLGVALWQLQRAQSAESSLRSANGQLSRALTEATTQRDRAELALGNLHDLTSVFQQFETSIQRLEGATLARKVLAQSARDVLQRLESAGEHYPWITRSLADSYLSVGRIAQRDQSTLDVAKDAFARSAKLYQALLEDDPDDFTSRSGMIKATTGLSGSYLRQGSTQAAVSHSVQAENAARSLFADTNSDTPSAILLAQTLIQRGGVLRVQGRLDEALASYREAEHVLTTLDAGQEHSDDLADESARAIRGQAIVLDELGRNDESTRLFQRAIDLRRAYVESHPLDVVGRHRLIELLYFAAERVEEDADFDRALEYHRERLRLASRLMHDDPYDSKARVAVMTAHDAIAHAELQLKNYDIARRSAEAFLSAAQIDAEADPTDLIKHRRVALAQELLGQIDRISIEKEVIRLSKSDAPDADRLGALTDQLSASLGHYTESLSTCQWLAGLDDEAVLYRRDICRIAGERARTLELLELLDPDREPKAQAAYSELAEHYAELDSMTELTPPERDRWSRIVRNLGTLALNAGQGARAADLLDQADAIKPRRTVSVLARKAAAYDLAGRHDRALDLAAQALAMLDANDRVPSSAGQREMIRNEMASILSAKQVAGEPK